MNVIKTSYQQTKIMHGKKDILGYKVDYLGIKSTFPLLFSYFEL